nr:colicin import rane protein [Phenylobacterium sp.]
MIMAAGTSAIATGAQATGGIGASASQTTLSAAAPVDTAAADQKLQRMRDAVVKLKTVGDSAKAARSGAAMAKLEALKQRLKMLMMMGGDPKAVARQAAQIAKEIGEAAKEYAAAGGGTPAPTPTAAQQTSAPAAAPGATAGDTPQTADDASDAATQTPGAARNGDPSAGAGPKTDPASAARPGAKTAASTGPSAPDPVIAEAKTLAARAKALLKAAIERAKREHADPADLKAAQDKLNAADKDIDDAARTLAAADTPTSYSASGQGVAAPAADAATSVSVQA